MVIDSIRYQSKINTITSQIQLEQIQMEFPDIPVDIFRSNILAFIDDVKDFINLSILPNVNFRRYMLIVLEGSDLSFVESHSGRYVLWLLRRGVKTRSIAVTGIVKSLVLEILISMHNCRSISLYANIVENRPNKYWQQQIRFQKKSNTDNLPRLLEEIYFHTLEINVDSKLLHNCPNLRKIVLYDANDNTLYRLAESHSDIRLLGLCGDFTDDGLNYLLKQCSNLESINLTGKRFTQNIITMLSQYCINIQKITIMSSNRIEISYETIFLLTQHCLNIISIKFEFCRVTDDSVIALSNSYPNLLSISFLLCYITDNSIIAISHGCKNLQNIGLDICKNLTDISLIALSQCHQLKSIYISLNEKFTDNGIAALAQGCPDLECIAIVKCSSVTDVGIEAMVTGFF